MLIFGKQDGRVKRFETDAIFENLNGEKELLLLPESGLADYLQVDSDKWEAGVSTFLHKGKG